MMPLTLDDRLARLVPETVVMEVPTLRFPPVDGTDVDPDAGDFVTEPRDESRGRSRTIIGAAVLLVVLAAAVLAIYGERHSFADSLRRVGVWPMIASFGFGLLGVATVFLVWREVLAGLGIRIPLGAGARVFFVSQLGKYVPGSVWPALMQMEAGRSHGANRRTMLAANLIAIVLSCCIGLLMACLFLPFHDAHALARYWWALLALPVLVAMLHPRTVPSLLDRLFGLLHRQPLGEHVQTRSEVRAAGWSFLSWVFLGASLGVLAARLDGGSLSTFVLCLGAMALAWPLGVLFIPAPAGAGIRDVILVVILATIMTSGQALAVAIASRVIFVACDIALAGAAAIARSRARSHGWSITP
jgi:uncharacterized membrane protein YbhN (UPF0104 family)